MVNTLQAAVQQGDYAKFKEYTTLVDQRPVSMIRDLLKVKVADEALPLTRSSRWRPSSSASTPPVSRWVHCRRKLTKPWPRR